MLHGNLLSFGRLFRHRAYPLYYIGFETQAPNARGRKFFKKV
jgi:hypothetical protein